MSILEQYKFICSCVSVTKFWRRKGCLVWGRNQISTVYGYLPQSSICSSLPGGITHSSYTSSPVCRHVTRCPKTFKVEVRTIVVVVHCFCKSCYLIHFSGFLTIFHNVKSLLHYLFTSCQFYRNLFINWMQTTTNCYQLYYTSLFFIKLYAILYAIQTKHCRIHDTTKRTKWG